MSSFAGSWLGSAFIALALSFAAGSAHAQFAECTPIFGIPNDVLDTISEEAAPSFGDLSEQVCNGIAKKGTSTCKAQVKAADQCFRRAYDANYAIAVKQCQQLEDSTARSECKAEFKAIRDEGKSESEASKDAGIETCEDVFSLVLFDRCLLGVDM
jgi:hypothetical protein